jgi:transposase
VDLRRETDIEQLRRVALAQQVQIEQLLRVLKAKCDELESFKGNPEELQQTLALIETLTKQKQAAAEAASPKKTTKTPKKRVEFGATEQPDLPHVEVVFELDVADRTCPSCGGQLEPMAGQFEESELVDFVEVSYRVVKVKQQKYVCRCGSCVDTALGPERAIRGGRYSLAFAIKVALDKYLDHIPLARQERILRRHGLEVTTQTLWDQLSALGQRLAAIEVALLAHALEQPVIGLDQTSWPKLEPGATKPWQMWCITAPGVVCHRIKDDKGAETFKALVGNYSGVIVCDALKTHEAGARDGPGILLAGCWAHVYRKFEEAEPDHPEANLALGWIGELYEIDERAGNDLELRQKIRRTESAEVLAKLKTWLWSQAVLKTLSIGKAAAYTIANWDRLTRFVENALVPLDNNGTERAIRGPVVGRKNHYGSKSRRGTEVAAVFYTLVETAKLHHVDPARYLTEAVRAADRGEVLYPWQLPTSA